jgi:PAS domain S-box-containing protein
MRTLSIRKQLLLLVLAVLLPMVAAIAYTIYNNAQQRVAQARSNSRVLAVVVAADVSRVVETNRDLLIQLGKRPLIRAVDGNRCDPVLWEFHELFPRSANMTTIDIRGEAICSAVPQPGGKNVMVDQAPWFKRSLMENDLVVSDPFFGPITGRWVTVLTYPIRDDAGKKTGFLGLPLDLALYQPNLSGAPLSPGTTVGIVTAKGVFVWRNLDTEKWVGKSVFERPVFQQMLAVKDGEYQGVGVDGTPRLYSVVPVKGLDWYVFVGTPASTVYEQMHANLLRNGLIGALILAVVLIAVIFVARRIEHPIQALASVSRSIRDGKWESRATIAGPPEIAEVAEEFNEMLDVRQRGEMALRESEKNLQHLLTNLPAAVVVHGADSAIQAGNPLALQILGLNEAQLLGKTAFDPYWHFIRDDGSVMPLEEYPANRVIAGKTPLRDYTVGIVAAEGKAPRWVSVSAFPDYFDDGQLRQVIVCFVDITERKNLEAALQREASEWTQAMDAFTDAIYLLDANRHLIRANRRFYTLTGLEPVAAVGKLIQQLLHPNDDGSQCPVCLAHEEKRDALFTMEADHPDNPTNLPMEVTVKILRDASGAVTGILTALHDLTRTRAIEAELRMLNQNLETRVGEEVKKNREKDHLLIQQSRLAAMGEMVHNIAHQWRQPLNALAILLANVRDEYAYNELTLEKLDDDLAVGNRLIDKMSHTIDDFRNFFSPNKEKSSFKLAEAVEQALAIISAGFESHNITVEVDTAEDVSAYGYPNEFSQALLNIINNAKEALQVRKQSAGVIDIRIAREDGMATLTIRDNAGGIPADVLPKIFDPYFTTKEKGSGIGLYMTKMIIENSMGGSIAVRNIAGGVEFVLTCPLCAE